MKMKLVGLAAALMAMFGTAAGGGNESGIYGLLPTV